MGAAPKGDLNLIWEWELPALPISISALRAGVGMRNPQTTPKNALWREFPLFRENCYFLFLMK